MIFKQFYLSCLAQASYLIGDEQTRTAAIVDPRRDVDLYFEEADRHGLQIRHVFLTHFHADFVAGHLELRDRAGAAIHLGARARAEYPFTPMKEEDAVDFGRVRLRVIETPGHTAESISILVYDLERDASRPHAVLTGDTLFVGDVGRPDLRAALGWSAVDLGGMLFDSLHAKLLALPNATLVYPAHGAGSLCGKAISTDTVSTIGDQRRVNYALRPMTKAAFVDLVTTDQPDAPAYFTYDAVLNSRERPTLDQALAREMKPLRLDEVLAMQAAGAQVLDTRDPSEFASTHLANSINIGLGGQYATWAGTILDTTQPIIIVAQPGAEAESAMRLGRIGFDQVAGFLEGGLATVGSRPELIVSTDRLSPETAAQRIASATPPLAIDVRSARERAEKWIAETVHKPLNSLHAAALVLPRDKPLLVFSAGGYRSSTAASLLQRDGFTNVSELAGGIAAWESAGLPVARG